MKTIEDKRKIVLIQPAGGKNQVVGWDGVERIEAYEETGQMAHVTWFAVYKQGKICRRYNSAHIDHVRYANDN